MMTLYKDTYRIESARLKDWNYSNDAAYFVTICVNDMKNYFGKVKEEKVELSKIGKIANEEWQKTGEVRPNVILDEYVIMPNHIHGIIMIMNDHKVDTHSMRLDDSFRDARRAENENISVETTWQVVSSKETSHRDVSTLKSNSLGAIIGQFKSICTKRIHTIGYKNFRWQSRYYDRIIRNDKELFNIMQYIMNNPMKWTFDEYYRNEN
jgi:putative transposase